MMDKPDSVDNEALFLTLLENNPSPVFRYDRNAQRIYANNAAIMLAGSPVKQLLGNKPTNGPLLDEEQGKKLEESIFHVLNTGEVTRIELTVNSEEETLYFDSLLMPEYNADKACISVLLISHNITGFKCTAAQLRRREQEFRTLAENSTNIIVRYDRHFRRVYVNPTYERQTESHINHEGRQQTPDNFWTVVNVSPDEYKATLQRVMDTGTSEEILLQWPQQVDGQNVFHIIYLVPEYDTDGLCSGILAIGHDVTDFKRTEAKLRKREQEFRSLAENLPITLIRYDSECRRIYTNQAYNTTVGTSSDLTKNTMPSELWHPTNISAEEYMDMLRHVMETGENCEINLERYETDRAPVIHKLHLIAEYDAHGKAIGVLAFGIDISIQQRQNTLTQLRMSFFEHMLQERDLNIVLAHVANLIETFNPTLLCSIMLLDTDKKCLWTAAAPSLPDFYTKALNGIEIGEHVGSCGTAVWRKEDILVPDINSHPYWENYKELANQANLASCCSYPLFDSVGNVLGTFAVYQRHPGLPSPEDLEMIQEARHLAVIAIERKQSEEKLSWQAKYDMLTGLLNRHSLTSHLNEELARAEQNKDSLALLFIDLDRFKEVNDTMGHQFGDDILIEAAKRIQDCLQESDIVSRLGGDEFVAILPGIKEADQLAQIAQNIINSMSNPFLTDELSIYLSASIGIASYPADADNFDTLIACADQAMYAAKQRGRNDYSFFTGTMQKTAQERMSLANDLRKAISNNQLQVYYQPIINVTTQQVVKAEALLRWSHPIHGMVPPDHFIPIAEETSIIHEIGDWVFREAANTAKHWQQQHQKENNNVSFLPNISVNMSPRQFSRQAVTDTWIAHLQSLNLAPESIVIEITEGLLLREQDDIKGKLSRFRSAGMHIALDDFGTGYSAMAYLKKFHIDYLKIDRSFVHDLETDSNDRAIAEAIIVMAKKLGIQTIAEGVETKAQNDLLTDAGCDFMQGYLYAKPMPEDEFINFVSKTNRVTAEG